jgi:TP901 family phage tail tape measure protein
MGTTKEVVELLFNSSYNDAGTNALKRDLNSLSGSAQKGVSAVSGFTLALGAMELAAIAASIGLAKAGAEAAGSFGAGFAEISTLIEGNAEDLGIFKDSIKDYAAGSTASIEDINKAVYQAISAGVDYKDSIEFLGQAEKLSVAGKTDLSSAVTVLTGTLNAYGEETDQAGKYSDILFTTVKNGVTTIPELVSGLGKVTATAAGLGIGFDELSAATATMTKGGVATSETMTGMKAIITAIIKPTKEAGETADDLGIKLGVSALKSKGFAGVMQDIADKTGGSKEELTKLFSSTEALNGALALTSESGMKSFLTDLTAMQKSAGATDTAYSKMAENLILTQQTLSNQMQLTLIDIGEPILKQFGDINKEIGGIFNAIRANLSGSNGALVPVVDSVQEVATTVSEIIHSIATNMDEALNQADLSGFTGAFDSINEALNGLNLKDADGLASAIGTIGKTFEGLTKFSIAAGEVMIDLLRIFAELGTTVADMDGDTIKLAGTIGGFAVAIGAASLVLSPFVLLILALAKTGGVVGGFGSTAGINALSVAIKGLGYAGAAAALVWSGKEIGAMAVQAIDDVTGLSDALYGAKEPTEELSKAIREYGESIGKPNITMKEYIKLHQEASTGTAALDREVGKLGASTYEYSKAASIGKEELKDWNQFVENGYSWTKKSAEANESSANSTKKNADALNSLSQSAKPAADQIKNLGIASDSTRASLDGMAAIKPVFDFQTAKVESQAREVESIMGAMGESAKAAGDSLTGAFSVLGGDNYKDLHWYDKGKVTDAIDAMSKSQTKLADAEVLIAESKAKYMDAQVQSINEGDALIKIDGTGLAPELNAFMFAVLKGIQGKVASNQADFLLGMPT